MKKTGFSLKNAWYGLIALVGLVPVIIILVVIGSLLSTTFLTNALQKETHFNEIVHNHLEAEVSRFISVLENRSDPLAYALTKGSRQELIEHRKLIDNLIGKIIYREPAVHTVLALKPDGTIIAAQESYDPGPDLPLDRPALLLHWNPDPNNLPVEFTAAMQGRTYITSPVLHPEGVFFTITVPVGPREHPVAVLLAEIDASMLWESIEPRLTRENVKTYLIDQQGNLLNDVISTSYEAGDSLTKLAIVRAFVESQTVNDQSADKQPANQPPWQPGQEYQGLEGKPVFGIVTKINLVNWGVITEVKKEAITQPIRASLTNIALGVLIITALLTWLGLVLVKRIIRPISMLSNDFTRASQHDFSPTQVQSPIRELNTLVAGFNHMVSEIDASHRKLRKNEAKFSGIIQVSKNAIISINNERRIVLFNPTAERIFGYQGEEVIGQPLTMLLPTDICDVHDRYITQLGKPDGNAQDTMAQLIIQGRRKNGEIFPIEGSVSKLELDDELVYTIALTDITERKKAEDQLHQAAVVFESTAEGVIIADANGRITGVNNAFSAITGYDQEEVLGQNPSVLHSGKHDTAFYKSMWRSIEQTGLWQGEIWNRRKNGEIYPELLSINTVKNNQDEVSHYVGVFSDISTIKETEAKLAHLAHHDPLTSLPNRLLFNARLEHALNRAHRDSSYVAVLFLDLDRFKNINDSMGHPYGDKLLQAVSSRLAMGMRDEDTVARLGGDEFIIFVEDLADPQAASQVAINTLEQFASPFYIENDNVYVNVSIGISLYPENGEDVETLVKNADAAMYRAKEQGRNNYQFYSAELTTQAFERLSLETSLRHALERNEFILHYQPQVCLETGLIKGTEALVRWQHPEMGLVMPDKFIPIAEDTGLIVPIGEWVLRTACAQNKAWQDAGHPRIKIAVNLSARQLLSPELVDNIEDILQETGLEPGSLELEFTESTAMQNLEDSIKTLQALNARGIDLAIDDFGTGYSSLSYLRRFPIKKLKIDRSFVRDICVDKDDAKMIASIITLGQSLNLQIVAEGVETDDQLKFLVLHHCDQVQGNFVSPPVAAGEFTQINLMAPHSKANNQPPKAASSS